MEGDNTYKKAIKDGSLKVVGSSALLKNITDWLSNSVFSDLPSAREI
jgi:hypothetical protein